MRTTHRLLFFAALLTACQGEISHNLGETDAGDATHDAMAASDADSRPDASTQTDAGVEDLGTGVDAANDVAVSQDADGSDTGRPDASDADAQDDTGGDAAMDVGPECGNQRLEGNEACEQGVGLGATCQDLGFDGGTLGCSDLCEYDTSACTRVTCPNGAVEGNEDCEPGLTLTQTCSSLGFDGGTLGCATNCTWDTSACYECGDGVLNGNEACDTNAFGNKTCANQGFDGGSLACNANCTLNTAACFECGDGVVNGNEACDGNAFAGKTCQSVTPATPVGSLACNPNCTLDTSGCSPAPPNDTDNDGVPDALDPAPNDFRVCGDADNDTCDDCSVLGRKDTSNDGWDVNNDGMCEVKLDYACMNGANASMDPYRRESCVQFTLINQDRALFVSESGGGAPVAWNEAIWAVAVAHAKDMCNRSYFSHTNPEGQGPAQRGRAAGLNYDLAENIAVNLDPQAAQYAFMEEPTCTGHRGAVLQKRAIEVGVGYWKCMSNDTNYAWRNHDHVVQNYRWDFGITANAWCQNAANSCEIPPNPPTTAVCPAQLVMWNFCPVPSATTLNGWNCPND